MTCSSVTSFDQLLQLSFVRTLRMARIHIFNAHDIVLSSLVWCIHGKDRYCSKVQLCGTEKALMKYFFATMTFPCGE